uniref:Uncharacterized protein n=1 Tax=Anguilla anguilla TaxID=7936 RepID=A0A0E9XHS3_ANGAN
MTGMEETPMKNLTMMSSGKEAMIKRQYINKINLTRWHGSFKTILQVNMAGKISINCIKVLSLYCNMSTWYNLQ